jgi:hypothetical protein
MTSTSRRSQGPPRLAFACELDSAHLTELFADARVIADLHALGAQVTMMLSDRSPERAAVVQDLNTAGIPVVAVPLVPFEEGYYFTADNPAQAAKAYDAWRAWTAQHQLIWAGVGLDIEPDVHVYQQIAANPRALPGMLLPRLRDMERPRRAHAAYTALIDRIHADGYRVENYQFPLIADERRAGSTLLQRLFGVVDVATDREIWMLYTSFLGDLGAGLLWSYGAQAPWIALGSTGGAPAIPGSPQVPVLGWDEFARDLRLASIWCDDLLIHSLEGCVRQGFLSRLRSFDWRQEVPPPKTRRLAAALRGGLLAILWSSAHPLLVLSVLAISCWLVTRWRCRQGS